MWTIESYVGIGPLRLGASRDEVERLLGPARKAGATFLGGLRERRSPSDPICTFTEGRLVEVEVSPSVPGVTIATIDVFGENPQIVLSKLHDLNGGALAGMGSVLFKTLGVNTSGFIDLKTLHWRSDPDERSLTVFAQGQFDFLLPDLSPWTIPSL